MAPQSTTKTASNYEQDIPGQVKALRESFRTGETKKLETRRQLLLQIRQILREGAPLIKEALWKDLHKHPIESECHELVPVDAEVQEALDYLEDWTKPEWVGGNIANLPSLSYIRREPLGVACVIGTWNYPIQLTFSPLVGAIAAGNCVLLRLPGEDTCVHTNEVIKQLIDKYMDKRYVRYVTGGVEESKIMLKQKFDIIFCTGGTFIGKIVAAAAAETLTPTVLELGGKSPCIVDETADLQLAARRICWGAFMNCGQTCVRPDYLLVHSQVGPQLIEEIKKVLQIFFGKDPKEADCFGRIINQRSYDRVAKLLKADKDRVSYGGRTDSMDFFIEPTLLNFENDWEAFKSSATMSEEIFGPLLPIYYYDNLDQVLEYITSNPKPLSLYIYSTSGKNKEKVLHETSSGSAMVNDNVMLLTNSHVPFGGVGTSGMGSYHGKFSFEAFSHKKAVMYKYSLLDLAARYQPYTEFSSKILRLLLYPYPRRLFTGLKVFCWAITFAAIGAIAIPAIKDH
jgi:aldehyde dehydrogenase (NAD+)